MRVVFMGTPTLAARILAELAAHHEVALAVTRPDAVSGRGSKKRPSPVKEMALSLDIPVHEASRMDESAQDALIKAAPEAICVAAFGCLLPPSVLECAPYGCLNVHMSLLPRWRGAAPIERAMLEGDPRIGFSIMRMEEGLDTGPFCAQGSFDADGRYLDELEEELALAGAKALAETLDALEKGPVSWIEQDSSRANYASKIGKDELSLNPSKTAEANCACVRASSGAHPAKASLAERDVTIEKAHPVRCDDLPEQAALLESGDACFVQKRLFLICDEGAIEVERLKPNGKQSMDARAFCAGIQNFKKESKRWGASHER